MIIRYLFFKILLLILFENVKFIVLDKKFENI